IQIARWKNPARGVSSLAAKHQHRQTHRGDDAEDFSRSRQISQELSLFLQNLDPSTRVSRAGECAREPSLPFDFAQGSAPTEPRQRLDDSYEKVGDLNEPIGSPTASTPRPCAATRASRGQSGCPRRRAHAEWIWRAATQRILCWRSSTCRARR